VNDIDKIKKILELKVTYQKLEQCAVCNAKTKSAYFHNGSKNENGHLLCPDCNQLQISDEDVKGNTLLEYLYKRMNKNNI